MATFIASYEPSFSRTLMWVAAGHAVLILILLLAIWWTPAQARPVKFINMVPMGDLVQGTPESTNNVAQARAAAPPPQAAPAPTPPPQPAPPKAPVQAKPTKLVVKPTPQPEAKPEPKPTPKPVAKAEPKPEPKPAPKKVAKAEPKPEPKPKKKKIKVSLKEVSRPDQKASKPVKLAARTPSQAEEVLAKLNNVLEKAGSLKAPNLDLKSGARNGSDNDFGDYYALIRRQMFSAWDRPAHLAGKPYTTIVQVKLSPSGQILDAWLEETSGNDEHDRSALEAVHTVKKIARPVPKGMDPQVNITFRPSR